MGLSQWESSPGHGSRRSSRGIATRPIALRPIRHRQFDKVLSSCLLRPVSRCPGLPGTTRETLDQSRRAYYKLWNSPCCRAANVFHQRSSESGRTGRWWVRSDQPKRGWRGKWTRGDDNRPTTRRHRVIVRPSSVFLIALISAPSPSPFLSPVCLSLFMSAVAFTQHCAPIRAQNIKKIH